MHEKVESWFRRPFVDEEPGGSRPKGRRLRYAIGKLMSCTRCTRCTGAWCALGVVALRLRAPSAARTLTTVLAASAGNDFLHTGYAWLCARADAQPPATGPGPRAVPAAASAPRAA